MRSRRVQLTQDGRVEASPPKLSSEAKTVRQGTKLTKRKVEGKGGGRLPGHAREFDGRDTKVSRPPNKHLLIRFGEQGSRRTPSDDKVAEGKQMKGRERKGQEGSSIHPSIQGPLSIQSCPRPIHPSKPLPHTSPYSSPFPGVERIRTRT